MQSHLVADATQLGIGVLAGLGIARGQPLLAARLGLGDDLLQICTGFTTSHTLHPSHGSAFVYTSKPGHGAPCRGPCPGRRSGSQDGITRTGHATHRQVGCQERRAWKQASSRNAWDLCRAGLEGEWQGRPTLAELRGEGLERWGVVGNAEGVHLAGEHAVRRQLGDQG